MVKLYEFHAITQSWHETFELDTRYELLDRLNTSGNICLCNDTLRNQQVVVKKFNHVFQSKEIAKAVLRELKMLRFLKHESIVNLVSVLAPAELCSFRDIYTVLDFAGTNNLAMFIASPQSFHEEHVKKMTFQIINAVSFLHTCGVLHRDLM